MLGPGEMKYRVVTVLLPISSFLALDENLSWVFRLANMSKDAQVTNQFPVIRLNSYAEPIILETAHIYDSPLGERLGGAILVLW